METQKVNHDILTEIYFIKSLKLRKGSIINLKFFSNNFLL